MRKRDLEMRLQSVSGFEDPDPSLEQYMTPAVMAADILFTAYRNGDVEGMKVIDLGCGTGMFSIGAWLLGAGMVVGFDRSESALSVARRNAEAFGADIEFRLCDIEEVSEGADTPEPQRGPCVPQEGDGHLGVRLLDPHGRDAGLRRALLREPRKVRGLA